MFKRIFAGVLFLLAFGLSYSCLAVTDTINGTVRDSTSNNPVQGVTVRSEGISTQTDANGVFQLVFATTGIRNAGSPRTISWDQGKQNFSWPENQKGVSLEVRNLSGGLVAKAIPAGASNRFSTARLPQGVYVVTIRTSHGSEVFKIVKVKTGVNIASPVITSLDGTGRSAMAAAPSPAYTVVFKKTGYNVVVYTLAPNTSSSSATIKILKSDFDSPFDPSAVPNIQPLFDGRTMTGWNYNQAGWSVQKGCIMGNPASGGQFCATRGLYDEFRWFATQIQVSGGGGHTGMGVAGANPTGTWNNGDFKFHDLMTPSCYFWDYYINTGDDRGTSRCVDMTKAPYNLQWQGSWYQVEMLVSISKGTIRAAMNGVDFLTHKFGPRNGVKPCPVGLQSHGGNGEVRYKDIWIELNPKDTTLLSVKK